MAKKSKCRKTKKRRTPNYSWDAQGNIVYPNGNGSYVPYEELEDTGKQCSKGFIPVSCKSVVCDERDPDSGKCLKWKSCNGDIVINGLTKQESIKAKRAAETYRALALLAKQRKQNNVNGAVGVRSVNMKKLKPEDTQVYKQSIEQAHNYILGSGSSSSGSTKSLTSLSDVD